TCGSDAVELPAQLFRDHHEVLGRYAEIGEHLTTSERHRRDLLDLAVSHLAEKPELLERRSNGARAGVEAPLELFGRHHPRLFGAERLVQNVGQAREGLRRIA